MLAQDFDGAKFTSCTPIISFPLLSLDVAVLVLSETEARSNVLRTHATLRKHFDVQYDGK